MKTDRSKVVSIMSFNSVIEAQLYKALLDSTGIQSHLKNDVAAQIIPAYGALMEVNLLVAEQDEAKAREVLLAKFDSDEVKQGTAAGNRDPQE